MDLPILAALNYTFLSGKSFPGSHIRHSNSRSIENHSLSRRNRVVCLPGNLECFRCCEWHS